MTFSLITLTSLLTNWNFVINSKPKHKPNWIKAFWGITISKFLVFVCLCGTYCKLFTWILFFWNSKLLQRSPISFFSWLHRPTQAQTHVQTGLTPQRVTVLVTETLHIPFFCQMTVTATSLSNHHFVAWFRYCQTSVSVKTHTHTHGCLSYRVNEIPGGPITSWN